jgi:hypothetical protein
MEKAKTVDYANVADQAKSLPIISENKADEVNYTFSFHDEEQNADKLEHGITDNMSYRTEFLGSWEAFSTFYDTIWTSPVLWFMMLKLLGVALVSAAIVFFFVPEPSELKVYRFTDLSKFLNVIVGLMLGFFMASASNRWYQCVNGFLELMDAIRNLQMQFVALGVPDKETFLCIRYGFASGWLLFGQLLVDTKRLKGDVPRDEMWKVLTNKPLRVDKTGKTMLLTERETKCLDKCRDPPGLMWMWVSSLIGRLAQDGWIPPMASPTYGRIMGLCQDAHAGIRQVRAAITVQAPFAYSHMLSTLVHINNLLNAVTFGIVLGVALGTFAGGQGWHPFYRRDVATGEDVVRDWQAAVICLGYSTIGPLVYQALLLLAMHLAQPFDSRFAYIPFDRLLHSLEVDLLNGQDLASSTRWERPAFKKQSA